MPIFHNSARLIPLKANNQLDWSLSDTYTHVVPYEFSRDALSQPDCTLLNLYNLFASVLLVRNKMKVRLY